jgi:exonuclease SbcD
MKILHTADWHLGIHLYNESLEEDHRLFISWLLDICIPEHKPDAILIAGDIFDKANPPTYARQQYYQFLAQLIPLGIKKVIITAGNHDSAAMLEAPKEILHHLNIHVVGNGDTSLNELLVPVFKDEKREPSVVIAAVPFLRDQDIRTPRTDESSESIQQAVREGIKDYYQKIAQATQSYLEKGIPVIAMGHLFASGVSVSDSERQIQVGNLGSVDAQCFPIEHFTYVALGHIHLPQNVQGSKHIWYSGSPIALSFSERKQQKIIRLLTVDGKEIKSESIKIPVFRELKRVEGDFLSVKNEINHLTNNKLLPLLIDIVIIEEDYNPAIGRDISAFINQIAIEKKADVRIANYRYAFKNSLASLSSLTDVLTLSDIKPTEVFQNILISNTLATEDKDACLTVFNLIMEEVQTEN